VASHLDSAIPDLLTNALLPLGQQDIHAPNVSVLASGLLAKILLIQDLIQDVDRWKH
jgi:hypothetical protein